MSLLNFVTVIQQFWRYTQINGLYMPIILSFHGFQEYIILKLCTKYRLCKINSLTSVANNNTMPGPI